MHSALRIPAISLLALAACGGGETVESGPSHPDFPCAEGGTITRTALSLERPELQPWLERVSGHHETSLRWGQTYLTDSVGGFEERTTLSVDVVVLGAEEVVFAPDAGSECAPARQLAMDVDVQLATGDGALAGGFLQPFYFLPDQEGNPSLGTLQAFSVDLESLSRTFQLELDPLLGVDPRGSVTTLRGLLGFGPDGIRGSMQAMLFTAPNVVGARRSWAPAGASFPDTCVEGEALDRSWEELGSSPRAVYDAYARRWPTEPMTARYTFADPVAAQGAALDDTQLSVRVGALTRVCDVPDWGLRFFGPVRLETSDGRVRFEQEMQTAIDGEFGSSFLDGPNVPAFDVERTFGITGVDLGGATHGHPIFRQEFSLDYSEMPGRLGIEAGGLEERPGAAGPTLQWCGPGCEL